MSKSDNSYRMGIGMQELERDNLRDEITEYLKKDNYPITTDDVVDGYYRHQEGYFVVGMVGAVMDNFYEDLRLVF